MARRRRRVLRERRRGRMPHGVPLPRDAAHVHGRPAGGRSAYRGGAREHAVDPRERPVGALPAQPRRADARDGDGRGARLHVCRVREGSTNEAEPRDSPASRTSARQRARRDRAAARDVVLAARVAGPLLRRRDRNGRQHLPRRPRRRPHPDAVDGRPQRRIQPRRLRAALPPAADGPGLRLSSRKRRGATAPAELDAALDPPTDRAAQGPSGVRDRDVRGAAARQPADLRPRSPVRGRHDHLRAQPRPLGPGGSARPLALARDDSRGDVRTDPLPADRRAAVPADVRAARVFLVPVEEGASHDVRRAGTRRVRDRTAMVRIEGARCRSRERRRPRDAQHPGSCNRALAGRDPIRHRDA